MSILRCDRLAILIVALFIPMLAHASTDTNKATVRQALAALEAGDVARINQLFDPKGLIHGAKGDTVQGGPATTLAQACPMYARLNGRQIQVSLIMAEDDLVTVRSK